MKEKPRKPRRNERAGGAAPATPRQSDPPAPDPVRCDLCDAPMFERHCRLVCPRCGYQRDCSDP